MKHIHTRTILGFCLVVIMMFRAVVLVHAMSIDSLVESVTNPFGRFVDEAQKTATNSVPQAPALDSIKNVNLGALEPRAAFTNLKNWLRDRVGDIGVSGIIKKIGALIADIMSYIANFLRRALELLPG